MNDEWQMAICLHAETGVRLHMGLVGKSTIDRQ